MGVRTWTVRDEDGPTVGEVVLRIGGDSRAILEGRVFVGRKRVQNANEPVSPGDTVTLALPTDSALPDVVLLAREDDLVVVSKPAGIPTIPDHAGAAHALVTHAARLAGVEVSRLHPTSRLDRSVSGVVIFTLTTAAADRLKQAREDDAYLRRYVAIAAHAPAPDRGIWDAPIGRAKDPRHRAALGKDAVPARTVYATTAISTAGQALLALSPITGRTHQIRVHAAHAGVPLLGDRTYGGPSRITLSSGRVLSFSRIFLHCARVAIPSLTVEAPVPPALSEMWATLGGDASAWDTAVSCVLDV